MLELNICKGWYQLSKSSVKTTEGESDEARKGKICVYKILQILVLNLFRWSPKFDSIAKAHLTLRLFRE
jgi:hypothetical protein